MFQYFKHRLPVLLLLLAVLAVMLGIQFVIDKPEDGIKIRVEGVSMEDTLEANDVIYYQEDKELNRFDIIIFEEDGTTKVKRIVGLPNETVRFDKGQGYIDDKELIEEYLSEGKGLTNDFEIKATDDCYIVMGDNRRNSVDSRVTGCIKKEDIKGVVNTKE